jgi:hypothetical protein
MANELAVIAESMIRKKHTLGLNPSVGTGFPSDERAVFARRSCSNREMRS